MTFTIVIASFCERRSDTSVEEPLPPSLPRDYLRGTQQGWTNPMTEIQLISIPSAEILQTQASVRLLSIVFSHPVECTATHTQAEGVNGNCPIWWSRITYWLTANHRQDLRRVQRQAASSALLQENKASICWTKWWVNKPEELSSQIPFLPSIVPTFLFWFFFSRQCRPVENCRREKHETAKLLVSSFTLLFLCPTIVHKFEGSNYRNCQSWQTADSSPGGIRTPLANKHKGPELLNPYGIVRFVGHFDDPNCDVWWRRDILQCLFLCALLLKQKPHLFFQSGW